MPESRLYIIENGIEGSGLGLPDILDQNLYRVIEENHESIISI
jgi:hypothetical protein